MNVAAIPTVPMRRHMSAGGINLAAMCRVCGGSLKNPGKEASCERAEGLLELSMECENDLVGELESGKGSCSRSRVVRPLFAYLVSRPVKSAESVPFDECIDQCNNNESEC